MHRTLRQQIQGLANAAVGDRADAALLVPALTRTLTTELRDFLRYFPEDGAPARMRDHAILLANPIAKRTAAPRKRRAPSNAPSALG